MKNSAGLLQVENGSPLKVFWAYGNLYNCFLSKLPRKLPWDKNYDWLHYDNPYIFENKMQGRRLHLYADRDRKNNSSFCRPGSICSRTSACIDYHAHQNHWYLYGLIP